MKHIAREVFNLSWQEKQLKHERVLREVSMKFGNLLKKSKTIGEYLLLGRGDSM